MDSALAQLVSLFIITQTKEHIMGMAYGSNSAVMIEESDLEKIVPNELKKFNDLISKYDIDKSGSLGRQLPNGEFPYMRDILIDDDSDIESIIEELENVYNDLCKAFNKLTGLPLSSNGTDDDGERYDDVNGFFWEVGNVYQLTPEAKLLQDQGISLNDVSWVTFG